MTKILITGGTGFIGSYLVKKLYEMGKNLRLLVRETSDISDFQHLDRLEYVLGNVTNIESLKKAIEGIDTIYHLAAYTGIWAKDKSIYEDINVKGTENIAKLALNHNIPFIYVSSFTALGPTPKEPIDENYEKADEFYLEYERTKYQAKKVVKEYFDKGLKGVIFYPGIVFGPGDFNIFGEMLYDIVRGKFMGCPGDGESIACFSYVNDIVNAMVEVLDRDDIYGEDYILGGENVHFNDYLCTIAEIANKKEPRHFPISLAKMYGWMCELKSKFTGKIPYITRDTLDSFELHRSYSSEKAIKDLGYNITPLKEALQETVKWYQEYIENGSNDQKPMKVKENLTEIKLIN